MAEAVYRFTLKSEETRGSTKLNIITLGLASDDDANTFMANIPQIFQARVASVNKVTHQNYARPYPLGTLRSFRGAMRDDFGNQVQLRILDVALATNPDTLAAALIAAGILMPDVDQHPVTSIVFTPFVNTPFQQAVV